MWERTKRLVNSYLDGLINKVEKPDSQVRDMTRAEISRLNDVEAQSRASAKMLEKEIAELDLKITGLAEREKIFAGMGNTSGQASAASEISALTSQRDMLRQQLVEANNYAERARKLRASRQVQGEELANQTHLTNMQETLAGIQSPFNASDPSSVMDEMRYRINRNRAAQPSTDVSEADREMERLTKTNQVEDMLSRYKQTTTQDYYTPPAQTPAPPVPSAPSQETDPKEEDKTLGPAKGPVRPID